MPPLNVAIDESLNCTSAVSRDDVPGKAATAAASARADVIVSAGVDDGCSRYIPSWAKRLPETVWSCTRSV
jgi:hypothetical protein